jgi:hypothetical protein
MMYVSANQKAVSLNLHRYNVGRCLAVHLMDHPTFRLGAIVGSSATIGGDPVQAPVS